MKPEPQIKALAELDGWRAKEVWSRCDICNCDPQEGHWTELPPPDYLTSYDAIIPAIQKQPLEIRDRIATKGGPISFMVTPAQLAEKLLRATGKWTE